MSGMNVWFSGEEKSFLTFRQKISFDPKTMSNKMDLSLDEIIVKEGIPATNRMVTNSSDGFKVTTDSMVNKQTNSFAENRAKRGVDFGPNCGKVFVDNLKYEVTDDDLEQLFSAFGPLKRAAINYNSNGGSAGNGFVVFERKENAMEAVKSLNNITLDDRPLKLTFIDDKNPLNGNSGQRPQNLNQRLKGQPKDSSTTGGGRKLWNELAKNYDSDEPNRYFKKSFKRYRSEDNDSPKERQTISAEDLDADLDSYLSKRTKATEPTAEASEES